VQHNDGLRCSDVLTDTDVVRQCCLLGAFGHVDHGYVGIVELIQHIRLTKVQPLKTDLVKINFFVNSETLPLLSNNLVNLSKENSYIIKKLSC